MFTLFQSACYEKMANSGHNDVVEGFAHEADRLLAALSSLCNRDNTDITILCDEGKFFCHSVLLKARSPVFFKMFESGIKVIKIDKILPAIMDDVIKYIYTGQVIITKEKMVDLVKAGDKFELPGLLSKCLHRFRNEIDFDNATDVLIMAEEHGLEEFKQVAINKIIFNRTMLLGDQDFREKMLQHPSLLLQLYDKLCQLNIPVNLSSQDIWTCGCGSSVVGAFCSWCGGSYNQNQT